MNENVLSVIIPSYNEEQNISRACSVIGDILNEAGIRHRLVFVDDGSKDGTWAAIEEMSKTDPNVTGLHFSRNFGKESAIYAGLAYSTDAACAVVIDCDLQHPPVKIVEMYRLWEEGYEVIEGVKSSRGKESAVNKLGAGVFYGLMSRAMKMDMKRASDFKLLDHKAVLALVNMREKNAFFRALSSWIGFKTARVEFDVQEREAGESKWSVMKLAKYAVNNLTSFSTAPMKAIIFLGIIALIVSVVMGVIALVQKFTGTASAGFTTVIILQVFSLSVIMISLGILGHYIAKIYDEVKGRPKFIISKTCGEHKADKDEA